MLFLDWSTVEEFFLVYSGVLPEYVKIIDQMISDHCLVMELDAIKTWYKVLEK